MEVRREVSPALDQIESCEGENKHLAHDLEMEARVKRALALLDQIEELKHQATAEIFALLGEIQPSSSSITETIARLRPETASARKGGIRYTLPSATRPELQLVSWDTLHAAGPWSEAEGCAIQMAISDYNGSDITEGPSSAVTKAWNNGSGNIMLPDKIRINSMCLIDTIRSVVTPGFQNTRSIPQQPLSISHPYKYLVSHETQLRRCLDEMQLELDATCSPALGLDQDRKEGLQSQETLASVMSGLPQNKLEQCASDLQCLLTFITEYLVPVKERIQNEVDLVSFSDLWFLFPTGSDIWVKDSNVPQKIWRVIQRTGGRKLMTTSETTSPRIPTSKFSKFIIHCYFIDYNGLRFVPVHGRFELAPFNGQRAVSSLSIVPFRIAEKDGITSRITTVESRNRFLGCLTARHMHYSGWSHSRSPDGMSVARNLDEKFDSEVIIDFERAIEEEPNLAPLATETGPNTFPDAEVGEHEAGETSINVDECWVQDYAFPDKTMPAETMIGDSLSESQLILLPDRVFGYVLRSRKWGK